MDGQDIKGVLVKGHLTSASAHHFFQDERPYSRVFDISHYKWLDHSLERVKLAYEISLSGQTGWEGEYERILQHYGRHGRFAWETFGGKVEAL
jgi:hypothetical protein